MESFTEFVDWIKNWAVMVVVTILLLICCILYTPVLLARLIRDHTDGVLIVTVLMLLIATIVMLWITDYTIWGNW